MSTTTIPTALAHDIVARLLQDRDTTARELRTRLMACMADATSPGLDIDAVFAGAQQSWDTREQALAEVEPGARWSSLGDFITQPEPPEPGPPALAEVTAWRESIEPAANTPEGDGEPEPGPLSFAIFVCGDYIETRDGYARLNERDVLHVCGRRCAVSLVVWTGPRFAMVHTQPLAGRPLDDGGPF